MEWSIFRRRNLLSMYIQKHVIRRLVLQCLLVYRRQKIFVSDTVKGSELNKTYLSESNGFIKIGSEVTCSYTWQNMSDGKPSVMSPKSSPFTTGIKVLNNPVSTSRGKTSRIKFQLTVPFGCKYRHEDDIDTESCALNVDLALPMAKECAPGIRGLGNCGISISRSEWNKTYELHIKHLDSDSYEFESQHMASLRTQPYHLHQIWSNVITDVQVNIVEHNTAWKGRACYAHSDPHMATFDGIYYDNQNNGTFVMYNSVDDQNNTMEIQIKVSPCNRYHQGIFCVCAVAARAAGDVYVIDRCPDSTTFFGFKQCLDNVLDIRKENDMNYKIYFPTGTYVQLRLWRYNTDNVIEVDIFPSSMDEGQSKGLCSTLGSHKLIGRDGRSYERSHRPDVFSTSWRVSLEENLMLMAVSGMKSFGRFTYDGSSTFCTCNKEYEAEMTKNEQCNQETCERTQKKIKRNACSSRSKRSIDKHFSFVPERSRAVSRQKKSKRQIQEENVVFMTNEEARSFCENYMNESEAFRACKDIPNVNTTVAIDACVLDIKLTNSTSWASASREGFKTICLKEIHQNQTLQNNTDDGSSVVEIIQSVACPNECSGHGMCIEGKCKCEKGYGAADCSEDLSKPPEVTGVNSATGGLCEKSDCTKVIVDGDMFLDQKNLTCKFDHFVMSPEGKRITKGTTLSAGEHNTVAEIMCPVPKQQQKRDTNTIKYSHRSLKRSDQGPTDFVSGYSVSVSNNGKEFSSSRFLYVLDSTCQDTANLSGHIRFILKDTFCFINGRCIKNGTSHFSDDCRICDCTSDIWQWTRLSYKPGCKPETRLLEEAGSYYWILGIVIGGMVLIAFGVLMNFCIKLRNRKNEPEIELDNPISTSKAVKQDGKRFY